MVYDGEGDWREWRLPGPLYANDLVLCGQSEEDLMAMVRRFIEVCRRRGMKVIADKSTMMVLNGEEGMECEVCMDGMQLEHVSEFKIFRVLWMNLVQMRQNVAGAIKSLVNARGLNFECARILHETLLIHVLIDGSDTMIWKEKERSKIRAI